MKVRNNMENPYVLCGVIIPPNGVGIVDDASFERIKQIPAFMKTLEEKSIEVVGVQLVSPGFDKTDLPPIPPVPPLNPNASHPGKKETK